MKHALPPSLAPRSKRPGCRSLGLAAVLAAALLAGRPAPAADGPPPLMSFQTRVLDSAGVPIAAGSREVIFRVFGVESGDGAALWAEKQTVAVKDGYISVILGQGGPLPAPSPDVPLDSIFTGVGDTERYIELEVAGTKISPRLRLLPSAYSFVSGTALRLVANSVESTMIRDGAVGNAALGNGSVTPAKLAAGAVTTAKLDAAAVTTAKIEDGAVTSAKIAAGNVGTTQLGDNSVNSAKILDAAVATADLADSAVTTAKLANGAATNAKLGDGSVGTSKLADSAVTTAKLGNGVVTPAKMQAGMFYTYTYSLGTSAVNTQVSFNDYYPVISSIYFGTGDLDEGGTGDLGGVRTFVVGGIWHLRADVRTHGNFADPTIRILWIPKTLISGSLNNYIGWQE